MSRLIQKPNTWKTVKCGLQSDFFNDCELPKTMPLHNQLWNTTWNAVGCLYHYAKLNNQICNDSANGIFHHSPVRGLCLLYKILLCLPAYPQQWPHNNISSECASVFVYLSQKSLNSLRVYSCTMIALVGSYIQEAQLSQWNRARGGNGGCGKHMSIIYSVNGHDIIWITINDDYTEQPQLIVSLQILFSSRLYAGAYPSIQIYYIYTYT
jgi:hypothetical protein